MKFLTRPLKLLFGIVLLLVVALFVVGYFADDIAKKGIEMGGSDALGVETTVDSCHIGFITGSFSMNKLAVANPPGFGDGKFLEIAKSAVELSTFSLLSDKIHVPSVDITGTRLLIVQDVNGSNYAKILDNLEKFQGASDAESEGKRFVIDRLTVKDTIVKVQPAPKLGLAAISIPVDTIELKGVGSESDQGVLLGDLAGILVESILKRASVSADLPGMIRATLQGKLSHLSGLTDAGIKTLEGFTGAALPPELEKGVGGAATDAIDKGLKKGLKKGLEGLGIR